MGKAFSDTNRINVFLGQSPKTIETKTKMNKRDLIKLYAFAAKESINKNEKTAYRMGENICKWCNQQGLNFENIQATHKAQQQKKQATQLKNQQKT